MMYKFILNNNFNRQDPAADSGVEYGFKYMIFMVIRKYPLTYEGTIKTAIGRDTTFSEGVPDFIQGGLPGFYQLVS